VGIFLEKKGRNKKTNNKRNNNFRLPFLHVVCTGAIVGWSIVFYSGLIGAYERPAVCESVGVFAPRAILCPSSCSLGTSSRAAPWLYDAMASAELRNRRPARGCRARASALRTGDLLAPADRAFQRARVLAVGAYLRTTHPSLRRAV